MDGRIQRVDTGQLQASEAFISQEGCVIPSRVRKGRGGFDGSPRDSRTLRHELEEESGTRGAIRKEPMTEALPRFCNVRDITDEAQEETAAHIENPDMRQLSLKLEELFPHMPPALEEEETAAPASMLPPSEEYIMQCYQRVLMLRSTCETKFEVEEGVKEILGEIAEKVEGNAGSEGTYSAMVDNLLMLHWTRKVDGIRCYDYHMEEHVEAIRALVKAWMKDRDFSGQRNIRIMDASCGTGSVLEAFLDCVPQELLKKLTVVANDISHASIEAARERLAKFEGRVQEIRYEQFDITREVPAGKYDVIILSQTLPLICDEKALRAYRLGYSLHSDEKRHKDAKQEVIESLIKRLKPGKGEFLLIDEDPMRLSKEAVGFDDIVERTLFMEIFKGIDKEKLIKSVMNDINEVRFSGHIESSIDRKHYMYLMAYRRDGNGFGTAEMEIPDAEERIIARMKGIHPIVIKRLQKFDADTGLEYRAISEHELGENETIRTLTIDAGLFEKIEKRRDYWYRNGSYDLVIISGIMHDLGIERYRGLIEKLKKYGKASPGGALLFIDQWPEPDTENRVKNGDARSRIMEWFSDHEFCASYRVGSKYGYLYVIRSI